MAEDSVTLQEETALRVKQLEVKFAGFEADTNMTDCCLIEIDQELEEGRVSVEKLEKRVTALGIDLPELFEERVATLKTENAELRDHLNLTIDTLNNVVKIINDQVIAREPADGENPDCDEGDHHNYLSEVYADTQSTLSQVYDMYQSQPQDEGGCEEMVKVIETPEQYEASLPVRVNGLTQDEWNDLLRI